jgi:hypothetical protein
LGSERVEVASEGGQQKEKPKIEEERLRRI